MAERRRGLLRQAHQAPPQARYLPLGRRPPGRHQPLHRRAQRHRGQTLHPARRPQRHHRRRKPRVPNIGAIPLGRNMDIPQRVLSFFGKADAIPPDDRDKTRMATPRIVFYRHLPAWIAPCAVPKLRERRRKPSRIMVELNACYPEPKLTAGPAGKRGGCRHDRQRHLP